jgi:hypothetical protein
LPGFRRAFLPVYYIILFLPTFAREGFSVTSYTFLCVSPGAYVKKQKEITPHPIAVSLKKQDGKWYALPTLGLSIKLAFQENKGRRLAGERNLSW